MCNYADVSLVEIFAPLTAKHLIKYVEGSSEVIIILGVSAPLIIGLLLCDVRGQLKRKLGVCTCSYAVLRVG